MHTFESWFCRPKLNLEVRNKSDFESYKENESVYSIYLVCESEANTSHEPFVNTLRMYGEVKHSVLYPVSYQSKQFFLIAPTQSEPKRLSLEACGKSHIASHFGAILAHAVLLLPVTNQEDAVFCVTLSERMKHVVTGVEQEFLIGLLQRSVSHKVKKSSKKSIGYTRSIVLREELFSTKSLEQAQIMSKAMCTTRTLINMPANILNPETYESYVREIVENLQESSKNASLNISMDVINYEQLENLGCGLICAVGQGSSVPPRIIKLTYTPNTAHKHVALVGKGITFDTGGYGIKPASNMRTMKKDMGGSASAFGVFLACTELQLPVKITCYLAIAENMISGHAMRPGDVYTAYNGLNVEIDHTDAEGRLVLADALALACEQEPDWIIDLATLTGAARTALGPLVDSVFGNRHEFNTLLQKSSIETGDWIWHMPLPSQYDSYFESRIADIMNSTTSPYAGAITAALFLEKFVGSCAWNHIDTFMWCDKAQGLWGEDNAPTAKCVRLLVDAIRNF